MNCSAFWISHKGQITEVKTNHITAIVNNAKLFGFSKEYIEGVYSNYGERIPIEGKARRELIDEAVGRGWIRLRRYRNSHWSITIANLDHRTCYLITDWANKMLTTGVADIQEKDPYMPIKFVALYSHLENKEYTVKSIAVGALLTESSQRVVDLNYVKTFKDFSY